MAHNNYITYQNQNYNTHTSHYNNTNQGGHFNSSQIYNPQVNSYNEIYPNNNRNLYGSNISMGSGPSSVKQFWNSDSLPPNSSNYNQSNLPTPPLLTSRAQPVNNSQPIRSAQCNNVNSYTVMSGQHASSPPQGWTQSPNLINSPTTTSSPIAPSPIPPHNRSPGHHYSPQTGINDSTHHKSNLNYTNQNNITSQGNSGNPLQSLEKMVMIDSENAELRNAYDNVQIQNNVTSPQPNNALQRSYYNSNDQLSSADPESPYPTYYNLDQNRLCTPPQQSPVSTNYNSMNHEESNHQMSNYCVTNSAQNSDVDVQHVKTVVINEKLGENSMCLNKDSDFVKSDSKDPKHRSADKEKFHPKIDFNALNKEKTDELTKTEYSSSNEESNKSIYDMHDSRGFIVNKRTSSRDSLHSSDSEQNAYKMDSHKSQWQMNSTENKNIWWPQVNEIPQPPLLTPVNTSVSSNYSSSDCRPPSLIPIANNPNNSTFQSTPMLNNGSWSSETNTPPNSSQLNYCNSDEMKYDAKYDAQRKKRGRPFGSKNRTKRRASEETNSSEKNTVVVTSPVVTKRKKKDKEISITTCEIGINTSLSVNSQSFEQLTIEKPTLKKRKTVGPFIRIEKEKRSNKTNYSIINVLNKPDDDKDVKKRFNVQNVEQQKYSRRPSLIGSSRKKVVSTLSPHYDLATKDSSWICSLCNKGPHYKGLGDLFGPYHVNVDEKVHLNAANTNTSQTSDSIDEIINAVVANETTTIDKKTRCSPDKRRSDNSDEGSSRKNKHLKSNSSITNESQQAVETEVWVHEDCIVWSSGVYLVGHRVRNLEEIIKDSHENVNEN